MTVHQAMRVLREESLVASYQGRGVFVGSGTRRRASCMRRIGSGTLSTITQPMRTLEARSFSGGDEVKGEGAELRRRTRSQRNRSGSEAPAGKLAHGSTWRRRREE
jgi:hypothetical protein